MTRLALGNIFHRKTRAAISIAAVAIQLTLVVVLVGLSTGTIKESGDRIQNIRADLLLLPPGSQLVLGMSTAVMPLEPVKKLLEATPGVAAAAPVTFVTTNTFGGYGLIFGIDPVSYAAAGRGTFDFVAGEQMQGPDDLVVDQRLARANALEVGQEVKVLGHMFTLSGIVRDGAGVRLYVPIGTMQDLLGRRGKASIFFVRADSEEQIDSALERLQSAPALKGYKVIASQQYTELLGEQTTGLHEFHAAVTIIAVVFGAAVILLSMYTTILERTRQIGILKSLGAGPGYIVREVMLEAGLLTAVGVPVGFALAAVVRYGLLLVYPTLNIIFSREWVVNAIVLALVSGLLGAVYPALRAARVDPVQALDFE